MTQQLTCRGKALDGKWIIGYYYPDFDDPEIAYILCMDDGVVYAVDPETVGQFTTLLDENGTRIFQGDVTELGELIVFRGGIFGTTYNGNLQGISALSKRRCENMRIIGNKHDNPSLISR